MAYTKVVSRLSTRLQPFIKLTKTMSSPLPSLKSTLRSPPPLGRISRLPVQLSNVEPMLPLHSAIASSRLLSGLSIESQSWGLVPQGISMPL